MAIPRLASILTLIVACIVLTHLNVAKLAAQEEKNATSNDQPESPKADAPDAKEPTQPTKDSVDKPKADPEPGKSAAEFATLLTEWKDIIKSLRNIQVEFQKAENEEEAEKLRKTFDNLVAKGDKLIPQIRAVGIAVYVKAPNEDRELTRLLCTILNDEVSRDMNESAFKLAEVLIANECERPGIHMLAGIAAFATNNFAKAEEYLKKAKEENETFAEVSAHTPQKIEEYLTFSVELQDLWTKELEIREKEAEADDLPRVRLTTTKGIVEIELFENEAPDTVGNFISLVEKPFYKNIKFHRVLPAFMAQTGCPKGDGSGGPGYTIFDECNKPEHRKHFAGSLSMAKTTLPDTGGSQFFMCFQPTPDLNGRHTVFGRVTKGMDVLGKLNRINPDDQASSTEPDVLIKAEVLRKRENKKYVPRKVVE